METANTANVTYGKPKVGGAIFKAPLTAKLPTDAKTALDTTFINLGYISDEGVSNNNSPESEKIKAWGGMVVLVAQSGRDDIFKFKLIESMNTNVLKTVHGNDNVTGDLDTGITVKSNSQELEASAWVIDMVLKGGVIKRIVIPNGTVTEIAEVKYVDKEAVGYEVSLSVVPDDDGNNHYEYILKG